MFKIQTLNTISPNGLKQFPHALYEVGAEVNAADAILVRSQNMHELSLPSSVKAVGRAGAGVNNIPVSQLTKLGIPVFNTPGANANAVRELVIAGMFLASRNICSAWQYINELNAPAEEFEKRIEQDKKKFVGFELYGKKLGVVGLGSIGVKVANAAISLGMDVIGFDPTITVNRAWELSANVHQAQNLDELLREADFITIHVPLNAETKNMLDTNSFGMMKQDVVILNFARDGIINHQALLHALDNKKVLSYVTDFPSVDFKSHPQVIALPHLGASTVEAEENCAVMVVKQVREFLENGNITNSVNFPSIEMPRNANAYRIGIVNANVPNMVAQISTVLAQEKLNIISLLNKSRDDIAYTLIDVNQSVTDNVINNLCHIEGVIQVRRVQ